MGSKVQDLTRQNTTPASSLENWRRYNAENAKLDPEFTVGIFGTFTTNTVASHIGSKLAYLADKIVRVENGSFQQQYALINNYQSEFSHDASHLVLLWRVEDLVQLDLINYLNGSDLALSTIEESLAPLFIGIQAWGAENPTLIVSVCEVHLPESVNQNSTVIQGRFLNLQNLMQSKLSACIRGKSNVSLTSWSSMLRDTRHSENRDRRNLELFHDPFTSETSLAIGVSLAQSIFGQALAINKKVLILDCDNTLWGGVVGEVGVDGIELGPDSNGWYFKLFQHEIKSLKERGVVLALCSKNNIDDVREVFASNKEMVLKWEDFVAHEVNWDSKPSNILKISKQLNILPDDFVFVDDSIFEISTVVAAISDVCAIQVPNIPSEIPGILSVSPFFKSTGHSTEDSNRTDLLISENSRILAQQVQQSYEEFIQNLELAISVRPIKIEDIKRVTQLINKTNQFNLTSIRRTEIQVQKLLGQPGVRGYIASARDKFGAYGSIGVCIIVDEVENLFLDSFLMSCRALGRELEFVFLDEAIRQYGDTFKQIKAAFNPTKKNAPTSNFLIEYGFEPYESNENQFLLTGTASHNRAGHIVTEHQHE